HLDRQVEANLAAGMSPDEARRQAAISFGARQRAREQCRTERPSWSLESLLRDVRYGIRGLLRNPGFSLVAVLTLALAIGANSTIFSLLSQALLSALPVHDPSQLVVLSFAGGHPGHTQSSGGNSPGHAHEFSYPMYRDLRDQNTVLSGLIAASPSYPGAVWNNRAEGVEAEVVTGNYFEILGVKPTLGRLFVASDETTENANPVVVLNFNYWKTHLAMAPVECKTLLLNGTPFTIVGVTPPAFYSIVWGRIPDMYVPITMQHIVQPEWTYLADRQAYWINLAGRLRPGISPEQASAAMNSLFLALRKNEFPLLPDQSDKARHEFIDSAHLNLEAGAKGFSPLRKDVTTPLTIIMGMVLLVAAMAVVNVASLLLVRAAMRVREFSMRYALGATSVQILRQLLTEGMLLGVTGAIAGLLIAPQALRLLIRWMSNSNLGGPVFSPSLDWRVFLFTLAVTLGGSLLFSLAPALQFWNPRLAESLKQQTDSGRGGSIRFRRTCVALQIGFSLLLIVAAGLFVRTIRNLRHVDPGFATDHILAFNLDPATAGYASAAITPVEQRAIDSLAALPGVRGVGATNDADLRGDDREGDVIVDQDCTNFRREETEFDVEVPWVSNNYLQTLGVTLVAGRYFTNADTATSLRVAIVNQSFARHYFGSDAAALGHRVCRPRRPVTLSVIVGVVKDVKHTSLRDPVMPTMYTLFSQAERNGGLTYYIRTWQPPQAAFNGIRAAIAAIDTKLILGNLTTLNDEIDDNLLAERTIALLAGAFGALATLLAGIGLYGILAYSTAQRTREIGIRMALGARRGSVVRLVLREVLILSGWAIGVTIPLAMLATRAVRSQLYGISIADPRIYAAGILLIGFVALVAGFIPSRRAAGVDPARALRTE
ncbi:MAG TPA: ABC transporter permease, partial [Candidatus Sulfopaludibacter sp.]|nr:ABC transporter permease [Candidatus Sulfopaludibacter sp.]